MNLIQSGAPPGDGKRQALLARRSAVLAKSTVFVHIRLLDASDQQQWLEPLTIVHTTYYLRTQKLGWLLAWEKDCFDCGGKDAHKPDH